MSFRVGESGKPFFYGTGIDISNNTSLDITMEKPDGTTVDIDSSRITAPAIDSESIEGVGILPANTYMEFTILTTDFDQSGTIAGKDPWLACGVYHDTVPTIEDVWKGSQVAFDVLEDC